MDRGDYWMLHSILNKKNGWVYLSFSHLLNDEAMTKIVRGKLNDHHWTEKQVLFEVDRGM